MTTGIEELKPPPKRKGRGPGKKPAMVYISLRVPRHVAEYFESLPNKSEAVREVLTAYVSSQTIETNQGESNGS